MTDSENHLRWNFQEGPRSGRVKVTKCQRRKLERQVHRSWPQRGGGRGNWPASLQRQENKLKWQRFFIAADTEPQTRFTRSRFHYQTEALFSCQVPPSSNQSHHGPALTRRRARRWTCAFVTCRFRRPTRSRCLWSRRGAGLLRRHYDNAWNTPSPSPTTLALKREISLVLRPRAVSPESAFQPQSQEFIPYRLVKGIPHTLPFWKKSLITFSSDQTTAQRLFIPCRGEWLSGTNTFYLSL